jgi:ComEC/Rec2-related protein
LLKIFENSNLKRPVLWLLFFLICGIVFGAELFAFIVLVCVCAVLYRVYRYHWQVIFFAAFFLLGAWRAGHSLHNHTLEPTPAIFSGVVLDTGYTAGGNQRAVIRGIHPTTGGRVRIMAYIRPHQRHVILGQEVTLTGELTPLTFPENPVGYNQFQHLRSQKIDAVIWAESIETAEVRRSVIVILREFRDKIATVYDEILPPREAAVIKSMILGDRLDMDRDLADLYRVMGIFHILSISGLHITIIMLAANKLLSLAVSERRAALVVLCMMILYCLMTGAAVATVRAVTMGGVLVGAKLLHRDYDLLVSVAWACTALLLYEPLYLFNVGFQLSFGAVFGIGVLTAPIERLLWKLKPRGQRGFKSLRKSLAVGIAAVVSTYIVFAYHFYEIPLYSVFGNLVIMPTVGIILVLGLIAGLAGLAAVPLAYFLSGSVYFILKFYEAAAVFFSELPFAMVLTGGGNMIVSALGVAVLCSFAYAFHGFENFKRRLMLFFACCVLLTGAVYFNANPRNLQITELDTFGEYKILRHRSDTLVIGAAHGGEEILTRYLDKRGTRRAALLLTHPPHPADAARLARLMPRVHTLYLPAHVDGVTAALMTLALEEICLDGINIVFLQDGDRRVIHGTTVRVRALNMGRLEVEILK